MATIGILGTRHPIIAHTLAVLVIVSVVFLSSCIWSPSPTPNPRRSSPTPTPVHRSPSPAPVRRSPTPTPADQNNFSFDSDGQILSNYWKPNGVVDTQHTAALNAWLAQNAPGADIATLIFNNRFATQRSKAVADLGLGNR